MSKIWPQIANYEKFKPCKKLHYLSSLLSLLYFFFIELHEKTLDLCKRKHCVVSLVWQNKRQLTLNLVIEKQYLFKFGIFQEHYFVIIVLLNPPRLWQRLDIYHDISKLNLIELRIYDDIMLLHLFQGRNFSSFNDRFLTNPATNPVLFFYTESYIH